MSGKKRKPSKVTASTGQEISRSPVPVSVAMALIIMAGVLAYANSFNVPFLFDDLVNIVDNPSIKHLWPLGETFQAPYGTGFAARPIVNFSFALNYAMSGEKLWSYHLLNLLIHILGALTLFGIIRRTLLLNRFQRRFGPLLVPVALLSTLIWMLHPIQTQAVTYLSQRCESLMGLFFLLTLYCAIRGWWASKPRRWHYGAILFFILGAGSKEVIVAAPLLVLLYELIFIHPSLKDILQKSWRLYAGFAIGMVILLLLFLSGGTTETGLEKVRFTTWQYWLTQPQTILHYLRLVLWPDALCFDYSWPAATLREAWPAIVAVLVLLAGMAWAFIWWHPVGFLGAWFFAILAPTALIPLRDIAFDFRIYLPLAALSVLLVIGALEACNFLQKRFYPGNKDRRYVFQKAVGVLLVIIAVSLGIATFMRNQTYQSDILLWEDAAKKQPQNSRAYANWGIAVDRAGDLRKAISLYQEALYLRPDYAAAHNNLGFALVRAGRLPEGLHHLQASLKIEPDSVDAHVNRAIALFQAGRSQEAREHLQKALQLKPDSAAAQSNMGVALLREGKSREAISFFQTAIRLKPDYAEAEANLGIALEQVGQHEEALRHYRKALLLQPEGPMAQEMRRRLTP